jgi:hypothetical protein
MVTTEIGSSTISLHSLCLFQTSGHQCFRCYLNLLSAAKANRRVSSHPVMQHGRKFCIGSFDTRTQAATATHDHPRARRYPAPSMPRCDPRPRRATFCAYWHQSRPLPGNSPSSAGPARPGHLVHASGNSTLWGSPPSCLPPPSTKTTGDAPSLAPGRHVAEPEFGPTHFSLAPNPELRKSCRRLLRNVGKRRLKHESPSISKSGKFDPKAPYFCPILLIFRLFMAIFALFHPISLLPRSGRVTERTNQTAPPQREEISGKSRFFGRFCRKNGGCHGILIRFERLSAFSY